MTRRAVGFVVLLGALLLTSIAPALAQDAPGDTVPDDTVPAEPDGAEEETTDEPAASVFGVLQYEGTPEGADEPERIPVPGVDLFVATPEGDDVGDAESDEDGAWEVALPGAGTYVLTLDPESLPDSVELRDPDDVTREVSVTDGQAQRVVFSLIEEGASRGRGGESTFDEVLRLTVEGIKFGLTIAMMAVGLSLIFGTTGLVNFAHGELVVLGAVFAWYINSWGIWLPIAAVLAMGLSFLFGSGLDRVLWRPLRFRGTSLISMLVISIGLSIFLRYGILYVFGGRPRAYQDFVVQSGIDLGPVTLAPKDIWAIGISLFVLGGVGLVLQFTRTGKAIRAVADNTDLAESSGIDVQRIINLVWGIGAALACLGGVLFSVGEFVDWQFGFRLLLLIFAGVTLGGLGSAYGALVGSLIVGIFIQVSTIWFPTELKNVGALIVLILILIVRPQGILGQRERIG
jgi:branched-chain amino acid transport system permease protein